MPPASDALPAGIIGLGRVGAAIAGALVAANHPVISVAARSLASRERAEVVLPGVEIVPAAQVANRADLVFLTVPDSQITPLATELAGQWRPGQIVVHAAGALGISALEPVSAQGGIALALHPAMSFSGTSLDVARLRGVPFAVEAPLGMLPLAHALVLELGGEPFNLPEAQRPAYHAALCHAANHLVTLVAQAADVLKAVGVEDTAAVLGPLARASLENALAQGFPALTGAAARGDVSTLTAHRAALERYVHSRAGAPAAAEVVETYHRLSTATLRAAADLGWIDEDQTAAGLAALDSPQKFQDQP